MAAKKIRITYEIWDEESREAGDTDDRGFIDEEGESVMPADYWDDQGSAVKNAIHYLRQHGPSLEPSEMGRGAAARWYTDYEYREDYRTGEKEERSYHLHGFSEAERREIQKAIEKKSYLRNPDKEIPIANPSDAQWIDELYLIWFGRVGTQKVYVWADGFESAFEGAVEWLDDQKLCGLFVTIGESELREAADDLGLPWPGLKAFSGTIGRDAERILESAEADLTLVGHTTLDCEKKLGGSAYVPSDEWGGREVTGYERDEVRRRSLSVPLPLGYDVFNVFQQYWYGQGDPLYAVLSRRGTSVDWVTVDASPEEIDRLEETAEEILESDESTAGDKRTAKSLLKQLGELQAA